MSFKVSTLPDIPPEAVEVTLNSNVRQWRAQTSWDRVVEVPKVQAQFTAMVGDAEYDLGLWTPDSYSTDDEKTLDMAADDEEFVQTTHWKRVGRAESEIVTKLLSTEHIIAELNRLAGEVGAGDIRRNTSDDPNAFEVAIAAAGNELNAWAAILEPNATLDEINSALPVSRIILEDLPMDSVDLNQVVQTLAGYQLALDPAVGAPLGQLRFLLATPERREVVPPFSEFRVDGDFTTPETRRISCRYIDDNQQMMTLLEGSTDEIKPVEQPANSLEEARLEIRLQRHQLVADHVIAAAVTDFDPDWKPLTAFARKGSVWLVLRVTHRIPRGNSPQTTELQLRRIGADNG